MRLTPDEQAMYSKYLVNKIFFYVFEVWHQIFLLDGSLKINHITKQRSNFFT